MTTITVIKLDHQGKETWRYQARLIQRSQNGVLLEAFFDREDTPVEALVLRRGDRFLEWYYADRWYNMFEIHDRTDDSLKGWYCNLGTPAVIEADSIAYRDLALDLLVYPNGRQMLLDEKEYQALPLSAETRRQVEQALAELRLSFTTGDQRDEFTI